MHCNVQQTQSNSPVLIIDAELAGEAANLGLRHHVIIPTGVDQIIPQDRDRPVLAAG